MSGQKPDAEVYSSDDEIYNPTKIPGDNVWEPAPDTILDLYEKLSKDGILEFEWKNPGRVTAAASLAKMTEMPQQAAGLPEVDHKLEGKQQLLSMFEEDDDMNKSMPLLNKTPKRSTTKQKASFDKIYKKVSQQAEHSKGPQGL